MGDILSFSEGSSHPPYAQHAIQNRLCLTGVINMNIFYEQSLFYPIHYVHLIINFHFMLWSIPPPFLLSSPPPSLQLSNTFFKTLTEVGIYWAETSCCSGTE